MTVRAVYMSQDSVTVLPLHATKPRSLITENFPHCLIGTVTNISHLTFHWRHCPVPTAGGRRNRLFNSTCEVVCVFLQSDMHSPG